MEKVELYIISFITKTSLNSVVGSICTVFYLSLSLLFYVCVCGQKEVYERVYMMMMMMMLMMLMMLFSSFSSSFCHTTRSRELI